MKAIRFKTDGMRCYGSIGGFDPLGAGSTPAVPTIVKEDRLYKHNYPRGQLFEPRAL